MKKVLLAGMMALIAPTMAFADGDADKGKKRFKKCGACHQVGPDAKNTLGPHLNGVVDRVAGSVEGYEYSEALTKAGEDGLTWDQANLIKWISKVEVDGKKMPGNNVMVKGNKMIFAGLKEDQAKDVVAYLKTLVAAE